MLSTLLILAGCGESAPLPQACVQARHDDVLRALRGAPAHATLADGTLLSTCADRSSDDASLQNLGVVFVAVADELSARSRRDAAAAFQLGFLIGAVERAAGPTGGTQGQLLLRLQQPIAFQTGTPAIQREVERGMAAGRRSG